ncbi:HPP family protein [Nitratireductor aquibiodomus]|uniref:HPP family protein n=1 Tax=Nitratireductor aquibiodomus TaxID=204799 RepID=A0A1H4LR31_9HYPH|nr:HPP family protein [Nitratireductor aquibiodomus]SEB73153.1 HPP family protein [Nitratireductor aquibiodomus]
MGYWQIEQPIVMIGTHNTYRYSEVTMHTFFTRHQPAQPAKAVVMAGIGGLLAIGAVGALSVYANAPLLMAPFGASCVLLFSVPSSPLSQPINVIGGHALSTLVGLALRMALPNEWWAAAIAVGVAIAVMAALRVTHPPAGADPLVVFASDPEWDFLFMPAIAGAAMLVGAATMFHRVNRTPYPMEKV